MNIESFLRIVWDVALYGPNGREHQRNETYKWLCSIRAGRVAVTFTWLGVSCLTSGNLVLLGLLLRRSEYTSGVLN